MNTIFNYQSSREGKPYSTIILRLNPLTAIKNRVKKVIIESWIALVKNLSYKTFYELKQRKSASKLTFVHYLRSKYFRI